MCKFQLLIIAFICFFFTSLAYSYQITNSYSSTIGNMTGTVIAISSYYADHNSFPVPSNTPPYGLEKLTTPVSYMSSTIPDVFSNPETKPIVDDPNSLTPFYIKRWCTLIFVLIPFLVICTSIIGLYLKKRTVVKSSIVIFGIYVVFYILTTPYAIADFKIHCKRYWMIWNYKDNPEIIWYGRGSRYHKDKNLTFRYNITKDGYAVLVSPGPDFYLDTDIYNIANHDKEELINIFIEYSPTNGMNSKGDIYSFFPDKFKPH